MLSVTRQHLKYNYSKTATCGDNPKIIWQPDNVLFNRHEEYEVLSLIKHLFKKYNWKNVSTVHKIEDMLKDLPQNKRSRVNVVDWIIENWEKYN